MVAVVEVLFVVLVVFGPWLRRIKQSGLFLRFRGFTTFQGLKPRLGLLKLLTIPLALGPLGDQGPLGLGFFACGCRYAGTGVATRGAFAFFVVLGPVVVLRLFF